MTTTKRRQMPKVAGTLPAPYPPQAVEGAEVPRRDVEEKGYLSPAEVAELLGISARTVMRRIADKTIPAKKVGRLWRVRRADLDRALSVEIEPPRPRRRR